MTKTEATAPTIAKTIKEITTTMVALKGMNVHMYSAMAGCALV